LVVGEGEEMRGVRLEGREGTGMFENAGGMEADLSSVGQSYVG
jgi:hypothetical protein